MRFTDQMNRQRSQIALLQKDKPLRAEEARRQRQQLYASLAVLVLIGGLLALLYRNNRLKQRVNALLYQQKIEIQHQRDQTQPALTDLKTTQQQLVQNEKMASLGELTAGIAHEIQNPLNFVNNFSEVSAEMVDERTDEQHKPQRDTDLETELITDLKDNLTKILHHGQRAKDKDFNCMLVTHLDATIGQVDVMSQEMGRVLLNLLTNAFYAVRERIKQAGSDYHPVVTVSTRKTSKGIEIRIADNSTGVADHVKAKIFQSFFTTKPTGEGMGLGLSLAYDIVTKGHGGYAEHRESAWPRHRIYLNPAHQRKPWLRTGFSYLLIALSCKESESG